MQWTLSLQWLYKQKTLKSAYNSNELYILANTFHIYSHYDFEHQQGVPSCEEVHIWFAADSLFKITWLSRDK